MYFIGSATMKFAVSRAVGQPDIDLFDNVSFTCFEVFKAANAAINQAAGYAPQGVAQLGVQDAYQQQYSNASGQYYQSMFSMHHLVIVKQLLKRFSDGELLTIFASFACCFSFYISAAHISLTLLFFIRPVQGCRSH